MKYEKIYNMSFSKIYPLLLNKALKKSRTAEEVEAVVFWLTGYDKAGIEKALLAEISYREFFKNAPAMNEKRELIGGTVCGVKIDDIEDPMMKDIRRLDKLIDQLAKGKPLDKILPEK